MATSPSGQIADLSWSYTFVDKTARTVLAVSVSICGSALVNHASSVHR